VRRLQLDDEDRAALQTLSRVYIGGAVRLVWTLLWIGVGIRVALWAAGIAL
jgi:hypothetical protein